MSYADLATLKLHLSSSSDGDASFTAGDNTLLQLCLDAATSMIDQFCKRTFVAEAGATKYFTATDPNCLTLMPDIRSVDSIAIDDDGDLSFGLSLAPADYWLMPLQSYPDPGIYSQITMAPRSSQAFTTGYQVKVVGDWGYVVDDEAPAPVREACLIQSARLYNRRGSPFGILQSADLTTFARLSKADSDVQALLMPYRAASAMWVMV